MSTTAPIKDKKISKNWESMKGDKNEIPSSFDFSNERNLTTKRKKGYDNHYTYTDENYNTCFVVERKKKDDGTKYFVLHSKQRNKGNQTSRWMQQKYPAPRPIYNLPKIANNKHKLKIVICEGEKAANAYSAKSLFSCTTWSCGAYAVLENDWQPVTEYGEIILCPDNDKIGELAMHKLAMHLHQKLDYPLENIRWVTYDNHFKDGWDLADDIPENHNGMEHHSLVSKSLHYIDVHKDYEDKWDEIKNKVEKKEINKEKSQRLMELAEDVIYIEELNEMLKLSKDTLVPLQHFNNMYAYLKIANKGGGTYLLEQESTKRADKFIYHPKHEKGIIEIDGITYANRFRPAPIFNIVGRSLPIDHWDEQLNYMFGEDADFVEQYFAWIYQNMGEKCMWAPLWISEQRGIGKNWVSFLISKVFGLHNSKPNLKYKNVISRFPDWIIGTQFAVVNEIFIKNRHDVKMEMSEEIKDYITEPFIHIEQKFRRSFDYFNTCNFLLISNHLDCMYVNNEERRYWIKVMNCQEQSRDYWIPKWKWLETDGPAALAQHLKKLTIKDPDLYKDRAPKTSDFKEMAANSEHPIFRWLDQQFEEESGPFRRSNKYKNFNFMAGVTWLHNAVTRGFSQECSQDVLKDWLKRRCMKWLDGNLTKQIRMADGTRPRVYMILPKEKEAKAYWYKHLISKTETELGNIYGEKTEAVDFVSRSYNTNS